MYITPGIPRLRFPDFSVIISPVEPKRSGIPCIIALWRKVINENILLYLLFRFSELQFVVNKEFTTYDKEQNYTGQYIRK